MTKEEMMTCDSCEEPTHEDEIIVGRGGDETGYLCTGCYEHMYE